MRASNQILAAQLAHLGEVQARGIHRERACASLYTYCLYELRLSEDAAFRRAKAARFVREFPKLLGAIARGELHLTGLLMLGPHLTAENLDEVLALAKHRTKREILALVRKLDPLPDVPPRIEPLGPAPARLMGPATPSWANIVRALAGPVRELPQGARPADWMPTELPVAPALERQSQAHSESQPESQPESQSEPDFEPEPEPTPPTLPDPNSSHLSKPQRYKVEFTASQAYVDLLEEARDLLSHRAPNVSMDELHVRALELLVADRRVANEWASARTPLAALTPRT